MSDSANKTHFQSIHCFLLNNEFYWRCLWSCFISVMYNESEIGLLSSLSSHQLAWIHLIIIYKVINIYCMFEQQWWSKLRCNLQTGNGNVNNSLPWCARCCTHCFCFLEKIKHGWAINVFKLNCNANDTVKVKLSPKGEPLLKHACQVAEIFASGYSWILAGQSLPRLSTGKPRRECEWFYLQAKVHIEWKRTMQQNIHHC